MGYNPRGHKEKDTTEQLTLLLLTEASGFLRAQSVKNPSGMQETSVRFLGWEDMLEKR